MSQTASRPNPNLNCSVLLRTAAACLLTGLLSACQQHVAPSAPSQASAGQSSVTLGGLSLGGSDSGVLTITLDQPLSQQPSDLDLEKQYGAFLIERTEDFALLRPPDAPTQRLSAMSLTLHSVSSEDGSATLETERNTVYPQQSSSGSVGIWGNGTVGIWGNGTVGIWGNGQSAAQANAHNWAQADLPRAQQQLTHLGRGIRVAVIDSGLDLEHPQFQDRLCERSTWRDFVDNDSLPKDTTPLGTPGSGHGTAVASVILQAAPNACVIPVRVLNTQGSGNTSDLARAILWSVRSGADIINLSVGSSRHLKAVEKSVLHANRHGVMVTAASGNKGTASLDYPAADFTPGSMNVAVGSLSPQLTRSTFGQYAPGLLLAPGEGIVAAIPGNQQAAWSGSSFSTALISGMLALSRAEGKPADSLGEALTRTPLSRDGFHVINADPLLP